MKILPLRLLLAASLLFMGCDSGAGPGVASPSANKGVSEGPATPGKVISAQLKKKREKQTVTPKGPQ